MKKYSVYFASFGLGFILSAIILDNPSTEHIKQVVALASLSIALTLWLLAGIKNIQYTLDNQKIEKGAGE